MILKYILISIIYIIIGVVIARLFEKNEKFLTNSEYNLELRPSEFCLAVFLWPMFFFLIPAGWVCHYIGIILKKISKAF
jgi:hypothetical protein